jgi:hypothetical protein
MEWIPWIFIILFVAGIIWVFAKVFSRGLKAFDLEIKMKEEKLKHLKKMSDENKDDIDKKQIEIL